MINNLISLNPICFFRVLWGCNHSSWGKEYPCGGAERIQLLSGCKGHPKALLPKWPVDSGLARQALNCRGYFWVQKTLQQTRESHINRPNQWDATYRGKSTYSHVTSITFALILFAYRFRYCCRAGTRVYAGNTLWKMLMKKRITSNTIIRGPSYAHSAPQHVQGVSQTESLLYN